MSWLRSPSVEDTGTFLIHHQFELTSTGLLQIKDPEGFAGCCQADGLACGFRRDADAAQSLVRIAPSDFPSRRRRQQPTNPGPPS